MNQPLIKLKHTPCTMLAIIRQYHQQMFASTKGYQLDIPSWFVNNIQPVLLTHITRPSGTNYQSLLLTHINQLSSHSEPLSLRKESAASMVRPSETADQLSAALQTIRYCNSAYQRNSYSGKTVSAIDGLARLAPAYP